MGEGISDSELKCFSTGVPFVVVSSCDWGSRRDWSLGYSEMLEPSSACAKAKISN